MKTKNIRDLTSDEAQLKLRELGQEVYKLRTQGRTGQLENSGKIRQTKRDIAKILTILKERESKGHS